MAATVFVGIVTYNSAADLPRCLESLRQQSYPYLSITILDNASTDETPQWLQRYTSDLKFIASKVNLGFGRGHNRILESCAMSRDSFYMALNPDVVLQPGYIECVVSALEQTGAGWATGKLLLPDHQNGSILYSAGHGIFRNGYAINIGYGLPDGAQFNTSREIFGAPGAAAIYRRALIESIAPSGELFDARMFMYGEDTDLDWRAQLQGWRCWYVAEAVAYHRGSNADSKLRDEAVINRYLSVIKNAFWRDLLAYNFPLIALHLLLRLVLTPRRRWHMLVQLLQLAPAMLRKRKQPRIPRAIILRWFQWAADQSTGQPVQLRQRLWKMLNPN
jgi:GT2 family glycosyltransferase